LLDCDAVVIKNPLVGTDEKPDQINKGLLMLGSV